MQAKGLYVNVEYADKDITAQIEPYLEVLRYTDNIDGDSADTLTVTLDDSQGIFSGPLYPVKGSALYFEFGYDVGDVFKSGKGFLIDTIKMEGGGINTGDAGSGRLPGTVVWTASANLPSHGIHTKVTKAWTQTTLEGIAKDIANKHGMDIVYKCDKTVKLTRLDQFNTSDLKQIKDLAVKYGLCFSIKAGKGKPTLVIADMDFVASKPPILKLSVGDCTSFTFDDSVAPNPKGRYTRYFDPIKKELVEFDYERLKGKVKDDLTGATTETLDGKGQQDRAIEREALEVYANKKDPNNDGPSATVNIPGNPSLLSGVVVELPENEWASYAGKWVITASTHSLDVKSGYKTTLTLKRYKC